MAEIKDENYYQISGFMINRLGLKGVALNVYAIIYGFSQDGENEYTGSLQYLCDFCGGVSKPTVIKALKELTEAGYIIRREEVINNVQFNRYKISLPLLKKFNGGSKKTLMGVVKNFNGGSKETLPNNNIYNNNCDCDTRAREDKLQAFKDNIMLTENQMEDLLETMGLEVFDVYCERLSNYINNNNAVVHNHYSTLLKWYNEDRAVNS